VKALHLTARHDSSVTNHIAELAHRDGETMKGISILGLVFLPGTFVSVSHDIPLLAHLLAVDRVIHRQFSV
jgi:hypothetical protein